MRTKSLQDQSSEAFNDSIMQLAIIYVIELGIRPSPIRLGPRKCSIMLFPNMRHTEDNSSKV